MGTLNNNGPWLRLARVVAAMLAGRQEGGGSLGSLRRKYSIRLAKLLLGFKETIRLTCNAATNIPHTSEEPFGQAHRAHEILTGLEPNNCPTGLVQSSHNSGTDAGSSSASWNSSSSSVTSPIVSSSL